MEKLADNPPASHVQTQAPEKRLLTDLEAAAYLSCKASTLRKWRCYGGGPEYVAIGSLKRYTVEALEGYIRRQKVAR